MGSPRKVQVRTQGAFLDLSGRFPEHLSLSFGVFHLAAGPPISIGGYMAATGAGSIWYSAVRNWPGLWSLVSGLLAPASEPVVEEKMILLSKASG